MKAESTTHARTLSAPTSQTHDYQQSLCQGYPVEEEEPAGEWRYVEERITAKAGKPSVELLLVDTMTGEFGCDDVRIDETTEAG
ncbi:MAG TPA: hypothetical protein VM537_00455 [Anaerolineae bacterium]|nr:hypothetical protein [Anaerolineae bacterium]